MPGSKFLIDAIRTVTTKITNHEVKNQVFLEAKRWILDAVTASAEHEAGCWMLDGWRVFMSFRAAERNGLLIKSNPYLSAGKPNIKPRSTAAKTMIPKFEKLVSCCQEGKSIPSKGGKLLYRQ